MNAAYRVAQILLTMGLALLFVSCGGGGSTASGLDISSCPKWTVGDSMTY
ncbi:MAG: hypothetical protein KKH12_03290 [Gammaproteobacteria bacterium]|nr:hypothetical protein [Gammaproteobacteria bacterium]MBU1480679.1 hypothetical protein [Gammaproteobacteria bacterium]